MFRLAFELVNQSKRNIFLTGKAGTGKTTFLRYLKENCAKQMAVVAPTGVAAINAGGMTIHSFFQLPFSPFVPEDHTGAGYGSDAAGADEMIGRMKVSREKIRVFEELELLVIDEISMVRCDTLDAIDAVLRHFRRSPGREFGGVQVLFIGDMFQLPPVTRDDVWQVLSAYYKSPYFFDARVLAEETPLYIEFNKVYRQRETDFISLLNQVRNNELEEDGARLLEERFDPGFSPGTEEGYILLTTHNETVRSVNAAALDRLPGMRSSFAARVDGDFPSNSFPADDILELCPGAQVMFIRNDSAERGKRFYNGKIGVVSRVEADKIWVDCGEEEEIEVKRDRWENIRYTVNDASRKLEEDVLGSFSQFPLRLAWAITIHKSQGLTFEKTIVDAGKAFSPGQVYVALSRCTSLDGLVLKSRINRSSLQTDPKILEFAGNRGTAAALEAELISAQYMSRVELLFEVFSFMKESGQVSEMGLFLRKYEAAFTGVESWLAGLEKRVALLQETAVKFHDWIRQQVDGGEPLEENAVLGERVSRAAAHFWKELQLILNDIQTCNINTDNRNHARTVNEKLRELWGAVQLHQYMLQGFGLSMDLADWFQRRRSFVLRPVSVNVYGGGSHAKSNLPHRSLYWKLKSLRDRISERADLPIYLIAGSRTLEELVSYLPQTEEELEQIGGFGKIKVRNYGNEFLEVIREYCQEHNLDSQMPGPERADSGGGKRKKKPPEKPANAEKKDTKTVSYELFLEGRSVEEIAVARSLTNQTVEGHLVFFVESGKIPVEKLVSRGVILKVEQVLSGLSEISLKKVKELVGDDVSFGEIRFVLAGRLANGGR